MSIPPRRLLSAMTRQLADTTFIAIHPSIPGKTASQTPYSMVFSPVHRNKLRADNDLSRAFAVTTVALYWLGKLALTYGPLREDATDQLAQRALRQELTTKGLAVYQHIDAATVRQAPLLKGVRFDRTIQQLELTAASTIIAIDSERFFVHIPEEQFTNPPIQAQLVAAIYTIINDGDYVQLWEEALMAEFGNLAASFLAAPKMPAPAPLVQEIEP